MAAIAPVSQQFHSSSTQRIRDFLDIALLRFLARQVHDDLGLTSFFAEQRLYILSTICTKLAKLSTGEPLGSKGDSGILGLSGNDGYKNVRKSGGGPERPPECCEVVLPLPYRIAMNPKTNLSSDG